MNEVNDVRQRVDALREAGVNYVCASMIDSGSINRVKCFRLDELEQIMRVGSGFGYCWQTALSNDHIAATEGLGGPVGDMRMFPDLDRIVQLAATPEWAWVPVDEYDQEGAPLPTCPRQFLKRMVGWAAELGYELRMAYEFEWFMGKLDGGEVTPIHRGPGYSANAWAAVEGFFRSLFAALAAQGVKVSQLHPEYSIGQMEVALGVTDPVTVADWHVLFRHTVRSLSEQLGYKASFSPITSPGLGNGCHLHFSLLNSARENLFSGGDRVLEITAEGEAFMAGVLAELDALVALACPTVLSYERLKPERWAGAYHGWGHENREVALRFIRGIVGQRSHTANMEFKAGDCAGHPYLVPGAIIAAGLNGIERGMTLPEPLQMDPVGMTVQDQAARDAGRLPSSLSRAADALEASEVLRSAMGEALHKSLVVVRRAEAEADEGRSLEELMRELLWRF